MTLTLPHDLPAASLSLDIQAITQVTRHQSAQLLGRSFVDDPVTVAVYPGLSSTRRIAALTVDFEAEVKLCMHRGCPFIATAEGKVLGASLVYPPGGYPFRLIDQWYLLLSSIIGNGFFNIRAWMKWLDEVDKHHPKTPHYYLEYLGVEPCHQGKGLGSALLQHLLNLADDQQAGCYLENANPRNTSFYQRFGFQVMEEQEIIGVSTWFMWRPAK